MNTADIGRKLQEARKERGLTQEAVAMRLGTVSSYISDIERGVKSPSLHTFVRILEILNVSPDYILQGPWDHDGSGEDGEFLEKYARLTKKQKRFLSDFVDLYISSIE